MQAQAPQPAQVALAKPPVVSVPAAVVSSPGVTTLPMNVAGISVAIGQPQKATGQTVVAQPVHVQQLLKLKQQAVQQQKAIQPQAAPGPAAVQQKITAQQIAAQGQPQKVTYATQPALKTQFLTTPISQAQKLAGTQQVQTQIQVAKLPQVVQQQTPVASIQQVASASQQASPQTVTLTQATAAGQQVQMIPAVTATAQVVQQKLMQQQVVTTAAAQLQTPGVPNPGQVSASSDSPNQQPKLQMRVPAVRLDAHQTSVPLVRKAGRPQGGPPMHSTIQPKSGRFYLLLNLGQWHVKCSTWKALIETKSCNFIRMCPILLEQRSSLNIPFSVLCD